MSPSFRERKERVAAAEPGAIDFVGSAMRRIGPAIQTLAPG
jgi:hypothetical protein